MIPEKSMLLVTSHKEGVPTFRMMPISLQCPYGEVLYVPQAKVLQVFHKHSVEGLHMVIQLDGNGDPVRAVKPRADDNPYKQDRKLLNLPHDSYIQNPLEIEKFVEMFASNSSEFDYKIFMVEAVKPIIQEPETPKIILAS